MIYAYSVEGSKIVFAELEPLAEIPAGAIWIDLFHPSEDERRLVERALSIALPSFERVREIEQSSRFFTEGDALHMTTNVLSLSNLPNPMSDTLSFILVHERLITLRETDPRPISGYADRIQRSPPAQFSGEEAAIGLLEAFIDRIADIIEAVSLDLDRLSHTIFKPPRTRMRRERRDLRAVIRMLGRQEDIASIARESLSGIARMIRYLALRLDRAEDSHGKDHRARLRTLRRDIASLNEQLSSESQKINFLLNATLGSINNDLNGIIKIFSVVTVVFMPPTLVASIYGMNFENMPELDWAFGYPWALALMAVSALIPYLLFRRKGWL